MSERCPKLVCFRWKPLDRLGHPNLCPDTGVMVVALGLADIEFVKSMAQTWRDEQAGCTPLVRLAHPREVSAAITYAVTQLTFTMGSHPG